MCVDLTLNEKLTSTLLESIKHLLPLTIFNVTIFATRFMAKLFYIVFRVLHYFVCDI